MPVRPVGLRRLAIGARTTPPLHPTSRTPWPRGRTSSRNNLANAYGDAGRYEEAIPIHEATMRIRERVLGPEHPYTLGSRNNLAIAYQDAGRDAEAILIFDATLRIRERALGPEHPSTLYSRNNLATAYRAVGRDQDADALLKES